MSGGLSVHINIGASVASSLEAASRRAEERIGRIGKKVADAQAANLDKRDGYRKQIGDVVALGASMYGLLKPAIDFESSMADVRKVVDFDSPQAFKQMGDDILAMSQRLPMAANGIASIVAAAGQSGIAKNELLRFAESAAKMGIAFDMSAESAGETMAKWRTGMGLTQDEAEKLADAVNQLSNEGASKAGDVADVLLRQGAVGKMAGLAATQTAALASAMLSAGAQSDVAATGLKNFLLSLSMGESLGDKQKEALSGIGIEAGHLAKVMQKDAKTAIFSVLEALRGVSDEKRLGIIETIFGRESLGAIAPLIGQMDDLKKAFKTVSAETNYLGSATKEYESRSQTFANSLQLFQNRLGVLAVRIGSALLPPLNTLLEVVGSGVTTIGNLANRFPLLTKVVGLTVVGMMGLKIAAVTTGYAMTFLKGGALTGAAALVKMGRAAAMLINPLGLVRVAMVGLRTAMVSTGIGALVVALAMGGMWIANNWDNLAAMFDGFGTAFMAALGPARPVIEGVVEAGGRLFDWLASLVGHVDGAEGSFRSFGESVGRVVGAVVGWFVTLPEKIVGAITGAASNVAAAFDQGIIQGMASILWNFHPGVLILRGLNEIVDTLTGFNLFESGSKMIGTLVDGVLSKAGELVGAVKGTLAEVRQYLPFSDAKVGPLSELTRSGAAIPATIGEGVAAAGARPMATPLAAAFAGALALAPMAPGLAATAPAGASTSGGGGRSIVVNITVNGATSDPRALADLIAEQARETVQEMIAEEELRRRCSLTD